MKPLQRSIALIAAAAATLIAPRAEAQTLGVGRGDEIRIRSETVDGRFTVDDVNDGSLTLRDSVGSVVQVPMSSVTRLVVHRGPRTRGRGALRGLGIGFAAGAVGGVVLGLASGDDPPGGFIIFTAEEKALLGGAFLGATVGLVGAAIGAAAPGQLWEPVPLPGVASVGASRDGGVALGYTLRF